MTKAWSSSRTLWCLCAVALLGAIWGVFGLGAMHSPQEIDRGAGPVGEQNSAPGPDAADSGFSRGRQDLSLTEQPHWTLQAVGEWPPGAASQWFAISTGPDRSARPLGGEPDHDLVVPDSSLTFPTTVLVRVVMADGDLPMTIGAAAFEEPPADRVLRVDLRLASVVRGRVLDHEGLAVQGGVGVVLLAAGATSDRLETPDPTGQVWQRTATASDGSFAFGGLPRGETFRLSAAGAGWCSPREVTAVLDAAVVELDVRTLPLFGLGWRSASDAPPARWNRAVVITHRPAMRAQDSEVLSVPALRLLPAYAEYTACWTRHGAALRTAASLEQEPQITLIVDSPEFQPLRSTLRLERVHDQLPIAVVDLRPYGGSTFDLLVLWQFPDAFLDLDPSTVLGILKMAADDREWTMSVRRSDLDGLYLAALPASLSRLRFVSNSGVRFPSGDGFVSLARQGEGEYSALIDLTSGGVVEFELSDPAGVAYTGPVTVTVIEGEMPGPPGPGEPLQLPPRPAHAHTFSGPPYRVGMITSGRYHAALTRGVHMLGVTPAFDVADASRVSIAATVKLPN